MNNKEETIEMMSIEGYSEEEIATRLDDPDVCAPLLREDSKENKRNLRFGKKFLAGLLTVGIVTGATFGGFQLYKTHEVNRVKGYLEDFLTEDNYVDISCIDKNYGIKGFKGEFLREALENMDVKYVRIDDTFVFDIYDGVHVGTFKTIVAYKEETDEYYDPIRVSTENGVQYIYPEGFKLMELELTPEPFDYERLDGTEIKVYNEEDSDRLMLRR